MPAPDSGGTNTLSGGRIVETLELDNSNLGDGDLGTLTLQHASDQLSSSELETLANIQAEFDCCTSTVIDEISLEEELDPNVDVICSTEEIESVEIVTSVDHGECVEVQHSPESILPEIIEETTTQDVEMHNIEITESETELSFSPQSHTTSVCSTPYSASVITTKSHQPASGSIVVIQSPVSTSLSCSAASTPGHVTVSSGQIIGKISDVSGAVTLNSMPQFQTFSQSLVTAKSADGNVVQLRPALGVRQLPATSTGGVQPTVLQSIKPLQTSLKRPAPGSGQVFAKVIITGNQQGQPQPVMLSTSQATDTFQTAQPIKVIGSTNPVGMPTILSSPTKTITLAQAQQMGLISPGKLPHLLPSSTKQSIIVNKMVSPVKSPTKITMLPSTTVKSPTKILPAPVAGITPLKPTTIPTATVPAISSGPSAVNTTMKSALSPQKLIIRQGTGIKQGAVLTPSGSGQVIRIPATQNVIGTPGQGLTQIQMPGGRQVQYVRLVSASGSNTSNVVTTGKSRTTTVVPVTTGGKPLTFAAVRSQAQTVKMVPIAPATAVKAVVPKSNQAQAGQRILIPASAPVPQLRTSSGVTTLTASTVNQLASGATLVPSGTGSYVMLPAQYMQQLQSQQQQQQATSTPITIQQVVPQVSQQPQPAPAPQPTQQQQSILNAQTIVTSQQQVQQASANIQSSDVNNIIPRNSVSSRTTLEPNGIRPRKPCNCTKSQCLKLYCDCFANGEFCHQCNCNNCYNNLDHEEDRQRAIKSCLERNPNAFRPKIGKGVIGDERRHNKGCNCKRSGCLKNYCECYEAKIPCSNNCKCVGCRNVEETCDKKSLRDLAEAAEVRVQQQTAIKNKLSAQIQDISYRPTCSSIPSNFRQPFNFMTQEVLEATCLCLLAQAEEADRLSLSEEEAERSIIDEYGRCLKQIIDCAKKTEIVSPAIT